LIRTLPSKLAGRCSLVPTRQVSSGRWLPGSPPLCLRLGTSCRYAWGAVESQGKLLKHLQL